MPHTESARLRKLYQLELLDTPAERDFDEIVQLASQIAKTPISLITLLDSDRQWFKAKVGVPEEMIGSDRPSAVCNFTIQGETLFEVEDLNADRRFDNNKLVKGGPKLRYYAGIPLITSDGYKLGALCVIDVKSRNRLSDEQVFALRVLARQAMSQIELRTKNRELDAIRTIANKLVGTVGDDAGQTHRKIKTLTQRIRNHAEDRERLSHDIADLETTVHQANRSFANIAAWGNLNALYSHNSIAFSEVASIANECIEEMSASLAAKGNKVIRELNSAAPLPLPPEALAFILRNLLENANKYTENGEITLRYYSSGASATDARHYLCVCDTGLGLGPAFLSTYKSSGELPIRPGTSGEKGNGHGILLIRHLLERYGGKLHIDSTPGNDCNVIMVI